MPNKYLLIRVYSKVTIIKIIQAKAMRLITFQLYLSNNIPNTTLPIPAEIKVNDPTKVIK